jgi:hypothetical protein
MSCNNHEFGVVFCPLLLKQRMRGPCSCTNLAGGCFPQVPQFAFVHDLNAPLVCAGGEGGAFPWTQKHIEADRDAMMQRQLARAQAAL